MSDAPSISHLRFYPGGWDDMRTGLLGYLRFRVAGVVEVDGATVRRTRDGRLMVSWPTRRDAAGRKRFVVRPVDGETRRALDEEILALVGDRVGGDVGGRVDQRVAQNGCSAAADGRPKGGAA